MKRKFVSEIFAWLSVGGLVFSAIGLFTLQSKSLKPFDFALSIVSVVIVVLAGIFSARLARLAKWIAPSRRVFLSCSHHDYPAAREVAKALRADGAFVWLDEERLRPGAPIREMIEKGIAGADSFVALLSGKPRPSLLLELGLAQARGLKVIPVLLADAELPSDLQGLRYIDLRHGNDHGFEELVREVT